MALSKCPECGAQVSTQAKRCPSCGAPAKAGREGLGVLGWLAIGFIGLLFAGAYGSSGPSSTSTSARNPVLDMALNASKREKWRADIVKSGKPCSNVTAARWDDRLDREGDPVAIVTCDGQEWRYYTDGTTARN